MDQLKSFQCRNAALETELRLIKDQLTHSQTASARTAVLETELRLVKEQLVQFHNGSVHLVGLFGHQYSLNPMTQMSQQQEINNLRNQLNDTIHCNNRLQTLLDTSRRTVAVLQQREVRRSGRKLRALRRDEESDEGGDDVFGPRGNRPKRNGLRGNEPTKSTELDFASLIGPTYSEGGPWPEYPAEQDPKAKGGWGPEKSNDQFGWDDDLLSSLKFDDSKHGKENTAAAATVWEPTSGQAQFINWEAFRAGKGFDSQNNAWRASSRPVGQNQDQHLEDDGMEWDFSREETGCGSPPRPGSERDLIDSRVAMASQKSHDSKSSTENKTAMGTIETEDFAANVPVVEASNEHKPFSAGVPTSPKSKWPLPMPRPRLGGYSMKHEVPLKYRFTAGEHRALAGSATFIEDMTPEEYDECWYSFTRRYRGHSAAELREYYETEIQPAFRERAARLKAPSPEVAGGSEEAGGSMEALDLGEMASSGKADSLEVPGSEDASASGDATSHDKRRDSLLIDLDTYINNHTAAEIKPAAKLSSSHDAAVAESEKSGIHTVSSDATAVEAEESRNVSNLSSSIAIETTVSENVSNSSNDSATETKASENTVNFSDITAVETLVSETLPTISITPPIEAKEEEEVEHNHQESAIEEGAYEEPIETGTARPLQIRSFSKDDIKILPASPRIDPIVSQEGVELSPSSPKGNPIIPGTVLITGIPVGTKLEDILGKDVTGIKHGDFYRTAHWKTTPPLANTAVVQFYNVEVAKEFRRDKNSPFIGLLSTIVVDEERLRGFVPKHGGLRPPKEDEPATAATCRWDAKPER